ncbi:MAG: GIY-YIG nuclease family protein [Chloroflexi bacterium]|nr:GIY-YIG nuclease family protein [Chloroflexota bacterium]MBM4452317.1 GIY-YIG nuclease family protein [Chloroflexota bacterium]
MPYMYILECADGTYYTGSTVDLEKRLWEHENFVGANYTKKKQPVKLVHCEEFSSIDEAFHREKQVQGWSHAKKKALIEHNWQKVKQLSECRNSSHWENAGFDSAQPADDCKPETKQSSSESSSH